MNFLKTIKIKQEPTQLEHKQKKNENSLDST